MWKNVLIQFDEYSLLSDPSGDPVDRMRTPFHRLRSP